MSIHILKKMPWPTDDTTYGEIKDCLNTGLQETARKSVPFKQEITPWDYLNIVG